MVGMKREFRELTVDVVVCVVGTGYTELRFVTIGSRSQEIFQEKEKLYDDLCIGRLGYIG